MQRQIYRVKGMSCGHCKQAVESALQDVPGVRSALANVETGEVVVESDTPVAVDVIRSAIEEAGYEFVV
jgi:copper chaperone